MLQLPGGLTWVQPAGGASQGRESWRPISNVANCLIIWRYLMCISLFRNVVHLKSRPYACRFGCGEAFNHYATRGDHEKSKHGRRFPKTKEQDQFEKIFRPRQQT